MGQEVSKSTYNRTVAMLMGLKPEATYSVIVKVTTMLYSPESNMITPSAYQFFPDLSPRNIAFMITLHEVDLFLFNF